MLSWHKDILVFLQDIPYVILISVSFFYTQQPSKSPLPIILAGGGIPNFNTKESVEDMTSLLYDLNNATSADSGKVRSMFTLLYFTLLHFTWSFKVFYMSFQLTSS